MADETAAFLFRSNIGEVSADIEGGLQKINAALGKPLSSAQVSANAKALGQGFNFDEIERNLRTSLTKIQSLMDPSQPGGGLSGQALKTEYDRIFKEAFTGLPASLAAGIGGLSDRFLVEQLPVREMARTLARDFARVLNQEFKAAGGLEALGDVTPNRLLGANTVREFMKGPVVDYTARPGADASAEQRQAYLRNRLTAEQFVKRNPLGKDLAGLEREAALGLSEFTAMLRRDVAEGGITRKLKGVRQAVPTSTQADLTAVNKEISSQEAKDARAATAQETADRRDLADARKKATAALAQEAREEEAAAESARRGRIARESITERWIRANANTRVDPETGTVVRGVKGGADYVDNDFQRENAREIAARMQREQADYMRLVENQAQVRRVGSAQVYTPLDGGNREAYSVNDAAQQARRLSGFELYKILVQQDEELRKQIATTERLAAAEAKRTQRASETAAIQEAKTRQNQTGVLGGIAGYANRNDRSFGNNLGGQIASAAGYSLAYGSLFAVQQVMRDTMAEFLDYQDSVTDLEVATRSADLVTSDWVNSLSELSRVSGDNVGAALDTAARGVRAFTTDFNDSTEVTAAGDATTLASTQLALIANKPLTDTTGDVIATGTAFGLAPDQLQQVVDAVANAKRNVGGDAAQVSQGLSLIALSAQEAGFNLNEAAAVMSLVQARTDQSGTAIATRLTRIFQIVSGSTGKALARDLNIDPTQSVKAQLGEFAERYNDPTTSEAVKDRIRSQLGGEANGRELLPLLKEAKTLDRAFEEAFNNAGQGQEEFNRKSENLVGTLKKIQGDLKNLAVGAANSGLFDFVGASIKAIEPALYGVNQLLNAYNELPRALRTVTGAMLDVLAVTVVLGKAQRAGLIAGAAGELKSQFGKTDNAANLARQKEAAAITEAGVARSAAENRINAYLAGPMFAERVAAETRLSGTVTTSAVVRAEAETAAAAASTVGNTADVAGDVAGAGRFATLGAGLKTLTTFLTNPYVLATAAVVGGAAAYGSYKDQERVNDGIYDQSTRSLAAYGRVAEGRGSAEALDQAALDFESLAGTLSKTNVAARHDEERKGLVAEAHARASGLAVLAESVRKEEEHAAALRETTVFSTGAIEGTQQLADGMKALADAGNTPIQSLRRLTRALNQRPQDEPRYRPGQYAATLIGAAGDVVDDVLPEGYDRIADNRSPVAVIPQGKGGFNAFAPQGKTPSLYAPAGKGGSNMYTGANIAADAQDAIRAQYQDFALLDDKDVEVMQKAAIQSIKDNGINTRAGISDDQRNQIVQDMVATYDFAALGEEGPKIQQAYIDAIIARMNGTFVPKAGNVLDRGKMVLDQLKEGNKIDPVTGFKVAALNAPKLPRRDVIKLLNRSETDQGNVYEGLLAYQASAVSSVPESDDGTMKMNVIQANIKELRTLKRKNKGKAIPQLEAALAAAQYSYAVEAVEQAEDLRAAGESRAKNTRRLQATRLRLAKISVAEAGTNVNIIEGLFEAMDRKTVKSLIASQRFMVQAAKEAFEAAQHVATAASVIFGVNPIDAAGVLEGKQGEATKAGKRYERRLARLKAMMDALNVTTFGEGEATVPEGTGETAEEKAAQARSDAAALTGARAQARAARVGGGIADARAAITSARAELSAATKGTTEYFSALASLYSAQEQMNSALADFHATQYQLRGDITDPVENARDTLRASREKLRRDRGRGADIVAADRLDVRTSAAALEQARWDQKLSDMQTAEQLGRISYQTYLRYLQSESDRMHAMNGKTRQQIDHMNSIDLALKDAMTQMEGQFNLGDIDVRGFVYQTRRWAAENRYSAVKNPQALVHPTMSSINNNVSINGADIGQIRKVLRELMGDSAPRRTTASRRV